jgi:hypothetical protein
MNNDERVFLSDNLKDLIDLESLFEEQNTVIIPKKDEYITSNVYLDIKFIGNESIAIQLTKFKFKKRKKISIQILNLKENLINDFLTKKIEMIKICTKNNSFSESFHISNYNILSFIQYNVEDNYTLTIKIKPYK